VGEHGRITAIDPIQGKAELITKGTCDFERYLALSTFMLRPAVSLAIDLPAKISRAEIEDFPSRNFSTADV